MICNSTKCDNKAVVYLYPKPRHADYGPTQVCEDCYEEHRYMFENMCYEVSEGEFLMHEALA